MTQSTITPGPWQFERMMFAYGAGAMCGVSAPHPHDTKSRVSIATGMSAADARLLAAAPELLEALQDMIYHARHWVSAIDPKYDGTVHTMEKIIGMAASVVVMAKGGAE